MKKVKGKVLLVDDDQAFRTVTCSLLQDEGLTVTTVPNAMLGLQAYQQESFDLVLSDLMMEGMNGLKFVEKLSELDETVRVIMITGYASISSAVEAMKLGAFDYLTKPCSNDELILKVKKALVSKHEHDELQRLRSQVVERNRVHNIIGKSAPMQRIYDLIDQIADDNVSVMITGETGTGKELVAKALHYNSRRKNGPFIAVNCAALPETLLESELFGHEKGAFTGAVKQKIGRFEMADGGTLFLDEVGDIPLQTQVKLLRVLQERAIERVGGTNSIKTDIRLLSATNIVLEQALQQGRFRQDLFFRLNVMPINMPPLRERIEDIPLLIDFFIQKFMDKKNGMVKQISKTAMQILMNYDWPGNIRELENIIERAVLLCHGETIEVDHLLFQNPQKEATLVKQGVQQRMSESELNSLYARLVLDELGGNKKRACKVLDINFKTLQKRLG
jgi:DNA-binding NtrC family response regulator